MLLIIKEYLSLLKESKELDALLPDLLLVMGHTILSKPQIGVRQNGVDIATIGKDENGIEKLFLFVVKQGDLDRSDWNSTPQSVRPTMDEIQDVYIRNSIPPEYKNSIVTVVLCTGGDLKQSVQPDWNGYVDSNKSERLEFQFWGGDKLSLLIQENMFNENIFPQKFRSSLRKTLSLLSDTSYDMHDYYQLINDMLFTSSQKQQSLKQNEKLLRMIHLILNIIYFWAQNDDNIHPAILASEQTILNIWKFIINNHIEKEKTIISIFIEVLETTNCIYNTYVSKFVDYYSIKNGLSGLSGSADSDIEAIMLFDHLGIMACCALLNFNLYYLTKDEVCKENLMIVSSHIKSFISNHSVLLSPVYDDNAIDVSLALYVLYITEGKDFIIDYIYRMTENIIFAYNILNSHFPVATDNFDDVISECKDNKEERINLSTLFPNLAEWIVCIGQNEIYSSFQQAIKKVFPKTILELWYPDSSSENIIYSSNAARTFPMGTGYSITLNALPKDMEDFRIQMLMKPDRRLDLQEFSCVKFGLPSLLFISNRHFRTPFLSQFICGLITATKKESDE